MPQDLRAFWNDSIARLAREPLEPRVTELPRPAAHRTWQVDLRSLGGVSFRALFSRPDGHLPSARLPAIVTMPGYGGWQMGADLSEAMRGYAILQIYPRGQGASAELWRVPAGQEGNWLAVGSDQPEGYYYQGAYLDVRRGIDWLLTREDIDARRIGVMGTSQGGGIGIAVTALDPRVAAAAVHVPALIDQRRSPLCLQQQSATFARTYAWFDPWELAPWVQAPILLSAGGQDRTCPPATIREISARCTGITSLAYYPDLAHTSCVDFYALQWAWLDRYVRDRV